MPDALTLAESPASTELLAIREAIGDVDRRLVALLAERMQLAKEVAVAKRAAGVPMVDPAREAQVVRHAGELARDAGLPDDDVRRIFWQIVDLSRRTQATVR
jgi:chorismate mutase